MPSRWWSLAILLFWLIVMGPLLVRQAREQWEGDNQAPGFTIDLVDEAQRGPPEVRWHDPRPAAEKKDADNFWCRTAVHFNAREDVFELRVHLMLLPTETGASASSYRMRPILIEGAHTVTREGQLLKTRCNIRLRQDIPLPLRSYLSCESNCFFEGEVSDGQLFATLKETTLGSETTRTLEPVPVSRQGSIFNPLHPVNRIAGRRLDQHWTVSLVDPVREALDQLRGQQPGQASRMLSAHVLPQVQPLEWQKRSITCLKIEYSLEGRCVARTWIEQNTGLVIRQEAEYDNGTWVFQRESALDLP